MLSELDKHYPGANSYEGLGFFGGKVIETVEAKLYQADTKNLVKLIKQLRKDFNSPNAKFVCATLGQTKKGDTGNGGKILDAMFSVDESGKYPEFKGNVAAVYLIHYPKEGAPEVIMEETQKPT